MWIHGSRPGEIHLPKGYIDSVTSITTYQSDASPTVESSTDTYDVQTGEYGFIFLRVSASWTPSDKRYNVMKIIYKAGYSETYASVPRDLILAAKEILHEMYFNRSANIEIPEPQQNRQLYQLIRPYRTRLI